MLLADEVIRLENVTKEYPLYKNDKEKMKDFLFKDFSCEKFVALKNINLSLNKAEVIGILGLNGSGKSTLSNIITGVTQPTSGKVSVIGQVSMLSASAGMSSKLTGLENIDYKFVLLGIPKGQTEELKSAVIEFADIGAYITQPLRTYSSGMRARLGFAISVNIDPDILIIDEALAVGDESFRERCNEKIYDFKNNGKTIIYISHAAAQMEGLCDRVLWIHKGQAIGIGETRDVILKYSAFVRAFNKMTKEQKDSYMPAYDGS